MANMTKKSMLLLLCRTNWMARAFCGRAGFEEDVAYWLRNVALYFTLVHSMGENALIDKENLQKCIVDLYNDVNNEYIKL